MKKLTILLSLLIASCVKPPQDGTVMLVEKVKIVEAGKPDINIDKLVNFEPDENHTLFLRASGHEGSNFEDFKNILQKRRGKEAMESAITNLQDLAVKCKPFIGLTTNSIIATKCEGKGMHECVILTHNETGEQAAYCGGPT